MNRDADVEMDLAAQAHHLEDDVVVVQTLPPDLQRIEVPEHGLKSAVELLHGLGGLRNIARDAHVEQNPFEIRKVADLEEVLVDGLPGKKESQRQPNPPRVRDERPRDCKFRKELDEHGHIEQVYPLGEHRERYAPLPF